MKPAKRQRGSPSLPTVSDEMKVWCAVLVAEISDWPQVSARSFFGFTALYCKDEMFAALPRTRGMETANVNLLAFKLESPSRAVRALLEKTARPWASSMDKARWFAFELRSDADLHDALDWLGRAFVAARNKKSR